MAGIATLSLRVQGPLDSGTLGLSLHSPQRLIRVSHSPAKVTPINDHVFDKTSLRREMRARRRRLTPREQNLAAEQLARKLATLPAFIRSQHIALYWPNDGEIDPRPLAARAWRCGKECYLPVLHPFQGRLLWFVRWRPDTPLHFNRFGIPEPNYQDQPKLSAPNLNLVLLPLVAFDRAGGRLGMGGGFYDRTFAFKQEAKQHGRQVGPALVGLAHACQEATQVMREPWDIPLDAVVTDRGVVR